MLSQRGADGRERPISFESKKFSGAELNWPSHEKETAALVHAVRTWRHYIDNGLPFTAYTDSAAVKYLLTQPRLSSRQARWVQALQSFSINVQHLPGRLNLVADALSRRPDYFTDSAPLAPITATSSFAVGPSAVPSVPESDATTLSVNELRATTLQLDPDQLQELRDAYPQDPEFSATYLAAQRDNDPRVQRDYRLHDGLLYYTAGGRRRRLCVPAVPRFCLQLLQWHHDAPISGHLGFDKTYHQVARYYYWRGLSAYTRHFVASCDYCQRAKSTSRAAPGLLLSLPIPSKRWEIISVDFITGLPKTARGFDCITVFVDKLSKQAHFEPSHTSDDARALADLYVRVIFCQHGLSRQIISDRDSRFDANFWRYVMQILNVSLGLSTANHPQTDGQTERMNRTLEDMLRCLVNFEQDNWDTLLPFAQFAYNNSVHASTGQTPFYVATGQHPRLPQDLLHDPAAAADTPNPSANDFATHLVSVIQQARDQLIAAQTRQARYYNTAHPRRPVTFNIGDSVWVDQSFLESPEQRARPRDKLKHRRAGPFTVTARVGPNAYQLELPSGVRAHNVFNITALSPVVANTIPDRIQPPAPPIQVADGQEEFFVDRVLAHRGRGKGRQYLTVYRGERDIDATWQSRRNFMDRGRVTSQALIDYEARNNL